MSLRIRKHIHQEILPLQDQICHPWSNQQLPGAGGSGAGSGMVQSRHSSHFSHSSRSCALGPTLLPKERAEGRTWCCGSILISGMKFPNSLGNFIGLSCLSLLFPFSPRSLCCHLWEPTDFWGLFSIIRGQKWMPQALFYFFFISWNIYIPGKYL